MALAKAIVTEITNERYHGSAALALSSSTDQPPMLSVPAAVQNALQLASQGFNVMPLPYGAKRARYSWKRWQFTPVTAGMTPQHPAFLEFCDAFAGRVNYAVLCGKPSGNLLVLDCDTQALFDHYVSQLTMRGIGVFAVTTHRGAHIYLRTPAPVTSVTGKRADLDIKIKGYVLGAGSLHPEGVIYRPYSGNTADSVPVVDVSALDFLKADNGQLIRLRTRRQRYNADTRDYLQHGGTLPEGQRNIRLFKAASQLRNAGHSEDAAVSALLPIATASRLSFKESTATIASAYRDTSSSTGSDTAHHKRASAFAAAYNWRYRTGDTDRAVFEALIERCRLDNLGKGVFRASQRDLSVLSGFSTRTARLALQRLEDRQLIERAGSCPESGASMYRFKGWVLKGVSKVTTSTTGKATPLVGTNDTYTDTLPEYMRQSALWHRGFFGSSAKRVYAFLRVSETPQRTAAIQDATGLSESAVKRVMRTAADGRALRHHGLIEHLPEGYIAHDADAVTWAQLEYTVTNAHGDTAQGRRQRLKERYALERAVRLLQDVISWRRAHDTNAPYYGLSPHTRHTGRHADTGTGATGCDTGHRAPAAADSIGQGTTTPQRAAQGRKQAATLEDTTGYVSAPQTGTAGAFTGV